MCIRDVQTNELIFHGSYITDYCLQYTVRTAISNFLSCVKKLLLQIDAPVTL